MNDTTDGNQRKPIRRLGSKARASARSDLLDDAGGEKPPVPDRTRPDEPRSRAPRQSIEELVSAEADRPERSSDSRPRYDRRPRSRSR